MGIMLKLSMWKQFATGIGHASDGRGVSQLDRCKYNYQMLNYILDELMPWHRRSYDFSRLEVNQ